MDEELLPVGDCSFGQFERFVYCLCVCRGELVFPWCFFVLSEDFFKVVFVSVGLLYVGVAGCFLGECVFKLGD